MELHPFLIRHSLFSCRNIFKNRVCASGSVIRYSTERPVEISTTGILFIAGESLRSRVPYPMRVKFT
jgi:hypothetical protein